MYAVTSIPFVRRTRATLRRAEFGFLGVVVYTRVQTPRFWGLSFRAGLLPLTTNFSRPLRTSWLIVGTRYFLVSRIVPEHAARDTCGGAYTPTDYQKGPRV